MNMRRLVVLICCLALAACFTSGKRGAEKGLVIHDLGPSPAALVAGRAVPVAVEVRAPLWIDSLGINYRLAYAEASQLREYAQSRWAGPPSLMIQQRLQQQLDMSTSGQSRTGCVLRVEIGEFGQIFARPDSSKGVLQGRAQWLDRSRRQLAELNLNIEREAGSQNAAGGVAALQAAVGQLAADLGHWEAALQSSGKLAGCGA